MKKILTFVLFATMSVSVYAGPSFTHVHDNNANLNANANVNLNGNANKNSNSNKANAQSNAKSSSYSGASNYSKNAADAFNGGNNVTVEGDEYDIPANAVPMSIGGICTDAAAGQGSSLGVSISRANPVCEKLKMHEVYMKLGMREEALKSLRDAESLADTRGFFRGFLTVITLGIM